MAQEPRHLDGKSMAAQLSLRLLRATWRFVRRLFLGLFVLVAAVLCALAVVQLTPAGRAWVLKIALEQTNQLIPGRIEAARLDRLSLLGIELYGVHAYDPEGTEVLRLEQAAVDTDLSGLLAGNIALSRVKLEDAWVDLRVLEDRRGLIAAFVDPDAPSSPPSPGPGPTLLISGIDVSSVTVRLPPVDPVGQLDVELARLLGDFTMRDDQIGSTVETLELRALRARDELLSLKVSGRMTDDASPSRLELEAHSGATALHLRASGVLPTQEEWDQKPIEAEIDLRGLDAAQLAHVLRDPSLKEAFLGELALGLRATGTPRDLTLEGALETAGGSLRFEELSARGKDLRAVLSTEGIALEKVRSDLPPHRVALSLALQTSGFPPNPVDVAIQLRRATLDGEPLVDLDAKGRYHEETIENLSLSATQGESRLELEGQAELDGTADVSLRADLRPDLVARLGKLAGQELSGRLTTQMKVQRSADTKLVAEGSLSVDDLSFRPVQGAKDGAGGEALEVEKIAARFQVGGIPPSLRGKLGVDVENARLGQRTLDSAKLDVQGGIAAAEITLDAQGGFGKADEQGRRPEKDSAEIHLSAHVERGQAHTQLTGRGSGKVSGKSIEFRLDPTTAYDSGRIRTAGVDLRLAGQGVHLAGEVVPQGKSAGLDLRLGPVDLAVIDETLGLGQHWIGRVEGQAHLEGSLAVPRLSFEVSAKDAGIRHNPLVQLETSGTLDARAGEVEIELAGKGQTLDGKPGLNVRAEASWSSPGGPRFLDTLPQGRSKLSLSVERIESEFVKPYLPRGTLPVDAALESQVDLEGALADLRLSTQSQVTLRLFDKAPVILEHELGYEKGQLETQLGLRDGRGPLAQARASLHLPGPSPHASQMASAFSKAAPDGKWEVHLKTTPRSLRELDVLSLALDPQELPAIVVDLALDASHEPAQEPTLDFLAHVVQAQTTEDDPCHAGRLKLTAEAQHRGEQNQLEVIGQRGDEQLLRLEAKVPLALAPVLRGREPKPGAIDVEVHSEELSIAELPVVCNQGQGRLTLEMVGRDLLGESPLLELEAHALDFSLGGRPLLDLDLVAEANQKQISAELSLEGDGEQPEEAARREAKAKKRKRKEQREREAARDPTPQKTALRKKKEESKGNEPARPEEQPPPPASGHLAIRLPWSFSKGKVELTDNAPLDGEVHLRDVPLAPLLPKKGPISYARGQVSADIRARGKLNAPLLEGNLELHDVAFTATSLAQPLRDIQGRLNFSGRKLVIEHLEAHDRDGVLNLKGNVDLTNLDKVSAKIEIDAEKFPLRQRGQVVAITELSAVAETTVTKEKTEARLTLRNVDTWLESVEIRSGIDLAPHPEFVINGQPVEGSRIEKALESEKKAARDGQRAAELEQEPPRAAEKEGAKEPDETSELEVDDEKGQLVHIVIEADQRFWIKRKDFAVKLTTLLDTRIDGDEVRVKGEVVIDRGYLQLFGKVFDLTRESRLRFIGSNPPNPVLELEAEHKSRGGSVVSVRITGRGDAPVLQFFVDGEEVDAGVAVQELFGGQKGGDDSDATGQARSFVSGLTAGVLATAARRELGAAAPILMIDPSDKAGEGRVRAGFELDDIVPEFLKPIITGVYLEGIVAHESEGDAAANTQFGALLEFYFPKNFFTAGQYGPGTTWSIDVGWQL